MDSLVEKDGFKILSLNLIQLMRSSIKLTILQKQKIQKVIQLIFSTISSTKRRISWLEIQINANQITVFSSLKSQLDQFNTILSSLQSASSVANQLNSSETIMFMTLLSNFTPLLEGLEQRFEINKNTHLVHNYF